MTANICMKMIIMNNIDEIKEYTYKITFKNQDTFHWIEERQVSEIKQTNKPKPKPTIIGKPQSKLINNQTELVNKPPKSLPNSSKEKLETNKPQVPQRPIAPTPRPKLQPNIVQNNGKKIPPPSLKQRKVLPQRGPSGQLRSSNNQAKQPQLHIF